MNLNSIVFNNTKSPEGPNEFESQLKMRACLFSRFDPRFGGKATMQSEKKEGERGGQKLIAIVRQKVQINAGMSKQLIRP